MEQMNFQELFQNIAMVLMSAMGGSSGVLYGSAYLKIFYAYERQRDNG